MTLSFEKAARIHSLIRFGTSTWTYPGWKGIIYHRDYKNEKDFKSRSLEEYTTCPLFRTVGIDSTFYHPPKVVTLEKYAASVPEGFLWVSKVWERITVAQYPKHPRYGKLNGRSNPDFLNSDLFYNEVLPAYQKPLIREHTGPFVFQFPYMRKDLLSEFDFYSKLHGFLSQLPQEFQYAIEIRNKNYLTNDYFDILNETGATHCFNHWTYMPKLREQMILAAEAGGLKANYYVARILTPRGVSYAQAVKRFQPYDKLMEEQPEMREDVVRLSSRAIKRGIPAFIIVNNRCEGNAPMTIDAIGRMILDQPNLPVI